MRVNYPPGINGQPKRAYSSKPDRKEPWRYVCPNCEKQVNNGGKGRYLCRDCELKFQKEELKDLKT